MKKKVLVAMSGGIDSSVSAMLLKKQGLDIAGITMYMDNEKENSRYVNRCSYREVTDSKKVCKYLDIPHYTINATKNMEEKVIKPFIEEYLNGRTPNPCIECNKHIKFGLLFKEAKSLGFNMLATGHYAKKGKFSGRYILKKPKDLNKDQTYFLYKISPEIIEHLLFPLANLEKSDVIKLARQNQLPGRNRHQSQDICFIPDNNYKSLILSYHKNIQPGPIKDTKGKIIGRHKGFCFYTIGQREGLGISAKNPLYVLNINPKNNTLTVGEWNALKRKKLTASNLQFFVRKIPENLFARIRYRHKGGYCRVRKTRNKLEVKFKAPQYAVTPGQSIVFYKRNRLIGGGIINLNNL